MKLRPNTLLGMWYMYSCRLINQLRFDAPELTESQIKTDLCTVFWVSLLWGPLAIVFNFFAISVFLFCAIALPFMLFDFTGTVITVLLTVLSIGSLSLLVWALTKVPWNRVIDKIEERLDRPKPERNQESSWGIFKAWLIGLKHKACFSIELDTGYAEAYEELDNR